MGRWVATLLALALALAPGCARKPPYEGRTVAELGRMLDDPSPAVRVQGAQGLSLHGPEARPAVQALARALRSSDALLRAQAALALGSVGPGARDAVPELTTCLNDPEWSVRRQAALALGAIGPDARGAVPDLRRLQAGDPNGLVRKAVGQALPKIEGRKAAWTDPAAHSSRRTQPERLSRRMTRASSSPAAAPRMAAMYALRSR